MFLIPKIYQLRGLKDKRILKLLDRLRVHLRLPVDEDIDANEFIHKLLEKMLQDEVQLLLKEDCCKYFANNHNATHLKISVK